MIKNNKIKILIALTLSSATSVLFVFMRIHYSKEITYKFMIWNIFLAWIPFLLSSIFLIISPRIQTKGNTSETKIKTIILTKINPKLLRFIQVIIFTLWILFLPNSFYIITDLFHLQPLHKNKVPLWYDLILIISFAWNGLILGYCSLYLIHSYLNEKFNKYIGWSFILSLLLLSSFGIYIGRYQRWNSWDVFINPYNLVLDIGRRVTKPFVYPGLFGLTLAFSLFFMINYTIIYLMIKHNEKD